MSRALKAASNMEKKHNLLHVVGTLGMGGAEMLLLHYSKSLGNEGFNHYVYCFGVDGPIRPMIEDLGVSVVFGPKLGSIKNPFKFTSSLFSLLKNLVGFIKDNNIHTIHSHNGQSDKLAVVAGKLTGVPAFPTIHNTMFAVDRRSKLDPRVYMVKAVDQIIYRIAGHVIAVSEEVKTVISRRYSISGSKIIVVKNGIFFERARGSTSLKERVGLQNRNCLKLLAVGRLTYQKNFEVLVKATEIILKNGYNDIHVQIAGTGEDYDKLSSLVNKLQLNSYVELLGVRNDVPELMQESDLFIMPSRYEGLSIAMIESLANGLPVLASDAPGLKDYIHHGENGLLFPVGDYVALAESILTVVQDNEFYRRLSHGAKDSFKMNYDMRTNIKPLVQLMENYTG